MPSSSSSSKKLQTSKLQRHFLQRHSGEHVCFRELPIPFGNMPPAIAISIIWLGLLIEKDGVVLIAGVVGACLIPTFMVSVIVAFFALAFRFLMDILDVNNALTAN